MKRKILVVFLVISLLFNGSLLAYASPIVEKENKIETEIDKPLEVILTEEQKEAIRKAELEEAWKREVARYINKSTDQLTTCYLVGDFESGKILEEKNIDQLVAIASTSKILSVYVVLDEIKAGRLSKDDKIIIDKQTSRIGGSSYKLKEGEEVTVDELIKAAMIVSGNDAINALAKHIAGSEEKFVAMMKAKLDSLGISQYEIINVSGLPNYNIDKQNMLTTRELFQLSRSFIKDYPEILEVTKIPELISQERNFKEKNTNPILGEVPGVDGLKTGYTGLAGRCVVTTALVKGDGLETADMRLIGITMGSNSDGARYVAIKKLMENSIAGYTNQILAESNTPIETITNEKLDPEEINIYPKEQGTIIRKKSDFINFTKDLQEINPQTKAGESVGHLSYYLNDEVVFETDLIVKQDVLEASIIRKIQILYRNLYVSVYKMFNE